MPEDWLRLILESPQRFSIVDSVQEHKIIYANTITTPTLSPQSKSEKVSATMTEVEGSNLVESVNEQNLTQDALELPWHDKHWNLFITNAKSTVEVWSRLIGPDYSVRFDLFIYLYTMLF